MPTNNPMTAPAPAQVRHWPDTCHVEVDGVPWCQYVPPADVMLGLFTAADRARRKWLPICGHQTTEHAQEFVDRLNSVNIPAVVVPGRCAAGYGSIDD